MARRRVSLGIRRHRRVLLASVLLLDWPCDQVGNALQLVGLLIALLGVPVVPGVALALNGWSGTGRGPLGEPTRPRRRRGGGWRVSARERCNRCGGRFERSDDAVVPMLRCRNCLREVPARALPRRRSRWRERLLLTVALAIPASLAVAVALGFPDPDAGTPPLRLRVDGELIRAQVDTWQHGQMLCARLEQMARPAAATCSPDLGGSAPCPGCSVRAARCGRCARPGRASGRASRSRSRAPPAASPPTWRRCRCACCRPTAWRRSRGPRRWPAGPPRGSKR